MPESYFTQLKHTRTHAHTHTHAHTYTHIKIKADTYKVKTIYFIRTGIIGSIIYNIKLSLSE